ncbi:MAG: SGNH/GDSL hydrolase family protein, partial [Candidatus Marinimicrobia bacterium]|nr:SGNH/GDSL hydrolase family protein [Candidatus Neomarinimicrobiota bacterium]
MKVVKFFIFITIPASLIVIIFIEFILRALGPVILYPEVQDKFEIQADPGINGEEINRDYYPSKDKSVSLVFLGDSFLTPIGIEKYQLFPNELERILVDHFKMKFNTTNLGQEGFSTGQEIEAYRKYVKEDTSKTDLVILMFYMGNDLQNNCMYDPDAPKPIYRMINDSLVTLNPGNFIAAKKDVENKDFEVKPQYSHLVKHVISQLYTYKLIMNRLKYMPFVWRLYEKCFGEKVFNLSPKTSLIYNSWTGKYDVEWMTTGRLIKSLKLQVEKENSQLLVVIIPDNNQVFKESFWTDIFNKYDVPQDAPNRILTDYFKLNSIGYLDLFECFY